MKTDDTRSRTIGPWIIEWCCSGDQRGLFNIDSLRAHIERNCDVFLGHESPRFITSWIVMGIFPSQAEASRYCDQLTEQQESRGGPTKEDTRIFPRHDDDGLMKRLLSLRYIPYEDYLKTEHWKQVRKYALAYARNRCQICNATGLVDVHHRSYENRGDERMEDVIVLCRDCHTTFHERLAAGRRGASDDPANA